VRVRVCLFMVEISSRFSGPKPRYVSVCPPRLLPCTYLLLHVGISIHWHIISHHTDHGAATGRARAPMVR
jgi:hypothetical protein